MTAPVVAIVGRPNVGKSTLFNRIVGFKKAVVHDRPGVTRDRLYEMTTMLGRDILLIDTGGLEPEPDTDLLMAMRQQSLVAVEEADVIIFVVDARAGWTPADAEVNELLRRTDTPVVVAVNKVDGQRHDELVADFWSVGATDLYPISAEHGRGMYELSDAILACLPEAPEDDEADDDPEDGSGPIRLAVIGRPNIGKSTLINRLLGADRHLVFDQPGTTMDPVDSHLKVGDREYVLVDTAGVRKKARISDRLERFVSLRSIRSIERCHVSILLIDGTEGPTDQDAKLAQLVADRGRALIVLVNKWDLAKDLEDVNSFAVDEALERRLPHAYWAPHLFVSALTGKGVHRLLPIVEKVYENFNRRLKTPVVNRFLESATLAHSPPQRHHHPVRLYYMTQTRVRPPSFVVFSNTPEGVSDQYKRYLTNRLREHWDYEGVPIRLHVRKRRKLGEEKTS